jgi:hypothetical protein
LNELCGGLNISERLVSIMSERHFDSKDSIREFVAGTASDYRDDAIEWGTYEAATALYKDHDICPWSITSYFESNVPYDELSGPDPRDMIEHEAILCLEKVLDDQYMIEE